MSNPERTERLARQCTVFIDYTNHAGVCSRRSILPINIWWGKTAWHPVEQWLLHAIDNDKNAERDFAMVNIHRWHIMMEGT